MRWLVQSRAWIGPRLLLGLMYAARSGVMPAARAEVIHQIVDALRGRDFGEWHQAFRVKLVEIKLLLLLFVAVFIGLIVLWLAATSGVMAP
jgi:hypothetical protein